MRISVVVGLGCLLMVSHAGAQAPGQATRSVRDGVFTVQQAERGRALYATYCSDCHMTDMSGRLDVPHPSSAPALRGPYFIANWRALTAADLFERMRISMPQTAPGSLTRQQNADILAHILDANGYPAGQQELPSTRDPLAAIKIE
jgi:mono/diheme cytochrome c family protein